MHLCFRADFGLRVGLGSKVYLLPAVQVLCPQRWCRGPPLLQAQAQLFAKYPQSAAFATAGRSCECRAWQCKGSDVNGRGSLSNNLVMTTSSEGSEQRKIRNSKRVQTTLHKSRGRLYGTSIVTSKHTEQISPTSQEQITPRAVLAYVSTHQQQSHMCRCTSVSICVGEMGISKQTVLSPGI